MSAFNLQNTSTEELQQMAEKARGVHPMEACRVGMYLGALEEILRVRGELTEAKRERDYEKHAHQTVVAHCEQINQRNASIQEQLTEALKRIEKLTNERDEAVDLLTFHGHKIEARRNEGQAGLPQGECKCMVCRKFFAERDSLRSQLYACAQASKDIHAAQASTIDELRQQLTEAKEEKSLAERCYDEDRASDELCHALWEIAGQTFADFWTDGYDGSIEIVMGQTHELTREQADKILDLGFGQIYESQYGEPKGVNWFRGRTQDCSPREANEDRTKIVKLQQQLAAHAKTIAELREALRGLIDECDKTFMAHVLVSSQTQPLADARAALSNSFPSTPPNQPPE